MCNGPGLPEGPCSPTVIWRRSRMVTLKPNRSPPMKINSNLLWYCYMDSYFPHMCDLDCFVSSVFLSTPLSFAHSFSHSLASLALLHASLTLIFLSFPHHAHMYTHTHIGKSISKHTYTHTWLIAGLVSWPWTYAVVMRLLSKFRKSTEGLTAQMRRGEYSICSTYTDTIIL